MGSSPRSLPTILAAAALLIVAGTGVYAPGLSGPFLFDDLSNFLRAPSIAITSLDAQSLHATILTSSGEYQRRPLPRASFALNYYFSGGRFDEFAFKSTNLVIHLTTAWVIFLLSARLAAARCTMTGARSASEVHWLALTVSLLWMLHPVALTTVLYAVQRMTSLSALCVFTGLWMFCVGRERLQTGRPRGLWFMHAGLALGTFLGVLCKEIAVLTPLLAVLLSRCFWRADELDGTPRAALVRFWRLWLLAPLLLIIILAGTNLSWIQGIYELRDFTLWERLLTESRVLVRYLGMLLFPDLRNFGLFHDDIEVSVGFLQPPATLLCVSVLLMGGVAAIRGLKYRSNWAFGLCWFLIAHSIESTVLGLELMHEHRNYVPSFGIVLAIVLGAHELLRARMRMVARVGLTVLVVLTFAGLTALRSGYWADPVTLAQSWVKNHPASYRSREALAFAYMQGGYTLQDTYNAFRDAASAKSNAVIPLIRMQHIVHIVALQTPTAVDASPIDVDVLISPLSDTPEWLAGAITQLEAETSRRLSEHTVEFGAAFALSDVFSCAHRRDVACMRMAKPAVEWHRHALANPRITIGQRANLESSLAEYGDQFSAPSEETSD